MNEFEILCTDTVVAFYRMFGRVFVVMVISGFTPVGRSFAFVCQYRFQGCALDIRRDFHSGKVEESRGEVYVHADGVAGASCFDSFRIADNKRHALTLFVHEAFVKPTVFAKEETLVGSVDDNSIVQFADFFEVIHQATDIFIYR